MTQLRDVLETKDKENQTALLEYKSTIHKQEDSIKTLEKGLETILSQKKKNLEIRKKRQTSQTNRKRFKSLKKSIKKLTNKAINENLEEMKIQCNNLSKEKEHISKELVEYKSRFQSHDNLVAKLTEKLKSLANNYKDMQAENESLIKASLEEKTNKRQNVNKISELTKTREELEAELAAYKNLKNELETKLETSEKALKEVKENEEHLKEEKIQLEKEATETKQQTQLITCQLEIGKRSLKICNSVEEVREKIANKMRNITGKISKFKVRYHQQRK
ncbi:ANL_HP_G0188580.mRNA.1.CDS.1 [Saccharomyces cerevisiae]|nr:ANL_HP_G0188580.mRNA.1.CDS.1 [Saccharomyces cerevisiae]CAI6400361.1 ANL_HP_G0188580.mRNA.1.CDS.1 [Saccharomyces cerevisiae]